MTLGEFRIKTAHLAGSIDIMIVQTDGDNHYGHTHGVAVKSIRFGTEDIPRNEQPVVECLVLTDEV